MSDQFARSNTSTSASCPPDSETCVSFSSIAASPDGAQGSVLIHADAAIYAGLLSGDETATLPLQPGRKGYVQLVRGNVMVNGECLKAGDAAMLENEAQVSLSGGQDAEVLVFDLAN